MKSTLDISLQSSSEQEVIRAFRSILARKQDRYLERMVDVENRLKNNTLKSLILRLLCQSQKRDYRFFGEGKRKEYLHSLVKSQEIDLQKVALDFVKTYPDENYLPIILELRANAPARFQDEITRCIDFLISISREQQESSKQDRDQYAKDKGLQEVIERFMQLSQLESPSAQEQKEFRELLRSILSGCTNLTQIAPVQNIFGLILNTCLQAEFLKTLRDSTLTERWELVERFLHKNSPNVLLKEALENLALVDDKRALQYLDLLLERHFQSEFDFGETISLLIHLVLEESEDKALEIMRALLNSTLEDRQIFLRHLGDFEHPPDEFIQEVIQLIERETSLFVINYCLNWIELHCSLEVLRNLHEVSTQTSIARKKFLIDQFLLNTSETPWKQAVGPEAVQPKERNIRTQSRMFSQRRLSKAVLYGFIGICVLALIDLAIPLKDLFIKSDPAKIETKTREIKNAPTIQIEGLISQIDHKESEALLICGLKIYVIRLGYLSDSGRALKSGDEVKVIGSHLGKSSLGPSMIQAKSVLANKK